MRFFNLDLHIGVIGDIAVIFRSLGHDVTSWSISAHAWVLGQPTADVDVINQHTWRGLNRRLCDAFYERYKDELDSFDAFIVTHTPSFALLYERWNKPIICVASTRYEAPFSNDVDSWQDLNRYLREKIDSGMLIPIANNKYDAAYARFFTDRAWTVIPSLCEYTHAHYSGLHRESLLIGKFPLPIDVPGLVAKGQRFGESFLGKVGRRLNLRIGRRGHTWQDLCDFSSVVFFPYNSSIMTIFELYAAGVPMIFPSQAFASQIYAKSWTSGWFSELSYNQVFGLPPKSVVPCGPDDPNRYDDPENMARWIAKSDFYDEENLKHLVYVNSFESLHDTLRDIDHNAIHIKMKEHHRARAIGVYRAWKETLADLAAKRNARG